MRTPNYNRRADLVCFVNGLPLVFIELKAVYKNIRAGFDGNLRDYMDENVIAHAFHHNAFLIVSNGDRARYGSITSEWEHFNEWKRLDEADKGSVDAEAPARTACWRMTGCSIIVENFILFDESKAGADAQGGGAQPSGAGRQPRRGVGRAAGGAQGASSRPRSACGTASIELPLERKAPGRARSGDRGACGGGDCAAVLHPRRSGRHHRAGAPRPRAGSACSGTRKAAASPIPWPSSPRRCGARCRAISPSC